jgi:4-hydroxybenzoyl-CoA reductase subunit beta
VLRLPSFRFLQPTTLDEATRLLASEDPATTRIVAGGTDLFPNMKRRHQKAKTLLSLMRIPELRRIYVDPETDDLVIGATAILNDVADHPEVIRRYPALRKAILSISTPALRNMGTIGGNLLLDTRCNYYNQSEEWRRSIDYCMKEEGTVCWVAPGSKRCWAVSSSDTAPMLCALEASATQTSPEGTPLPVETLFRDDGIEYSTMRSGHFLRTIRIPASSAASAHCRMEFAKQRRRGAIDFAVTSVASVIWLDQPTHNACIRAARIYLGAVASTPVPSLAAAASMVGSSLTEETLRSALARARDTATPMDNTDFDPRWRARSAFARRHAPDSLAGA